MWFAHGGWWMVLYMVVFWGGVIALVTWSMQGIGSRRDDRRRGLSILEQRFASGAIDGAEFEERRRLLSRR